MASSILMSLLPFTNDWVMESPFVSSGQTMIDGAKDCNNDRYAPYETGPTCWTSSIDSMKTSCGGSPTHTNRIRWVKQKSRIAFRTGWADAVNGKLSLEIQTSERGAPAGLKVGRLRVRFGVTMALSLTRERANRS